jgi:hypothetical protein
MVIKERIFITIATKWSIRNLIVTDVLNKVAIEYDVILFVDSKLLVSEYAPLLKNFQHIIVEPFPEKPIKKIFRQLKKAFVFKGANLSTERIWKKYVSRPFYQRIGDYLISILVYFINYKWLFNQADKLEWKLIRDFKFDIFFKEYSPKYLMVSLLNTPLDESIISCAIQNNTEIRYLLMSWDHLSTKVVLNNKFKLIYLWTQINQNEVLELYDFYEKENLRVVGPPQFTIYNTHTDIEKDLFLSLLEVDFTGSLIYYSAAPIVRHSSQAEIILDLLDDWNFKEHPIHILFKIHPLDKLEYFEKLGANPNITLIDSLSHLKIKEIIPSYDEIVFNRDLLYYSEININIYSSVTLEAFLLGKPVIHIAYQNIFTENTIPCNEYYNFSHFEVITKSGASSIAYSLDQFKYFLNKYLNDPDYNIEKRNEFNNLFWGNMSNEYSMNLVNEMIS